MDRISPHDALDRAIELARGATQLARKIGVSRTAVSKWTKCQGRRLPITPKNAALIEEMTHGEVTAEQLLYIPPKP